MAKSPFIAKICKFCKAKRQAQHTHTRTHTHLKQVHMSFNFVRITMRQSFGRNRAIATHAKANAKNSVKWRHGERGERERESSEHEYIPFNQSNRLCNWLIKMNIKCYRSEKSKRMNAPIHSFQPCEYAKHFNQPFSYLKMAPNNSWRLCVFFRF